MAFRHISVTEKANSVLKQQNFKEIFRFFIETFALGFVSEDVYRALMNVLESEEIRNTVTRIQIRGVGRGTRYILGRGEALPPGIQSARPGVQRANHKILPCLVSQLMTIISHQGFTRVQKGQLLGTEGTSFSKAHSEERVRIQQFWQQLRVHFTLQF